MFLISHILVLMNLFFFSDVRVVAITVIGGGIEVEGTSGAFADDRVRAQGA